jgi:hypothetical protein
MPAIQDVMPRVKMDMECPAAWQVAKAPPQTARQPAVPTTAVPTRAEAEEMNNADGRRILETFISGNELAVAHLLAMDDRLSYCWLLAGTPETGLLGEQPLLEKSNAAGWSYCKSPQLLQGLGGLRS